MSEVTEAIPESRFDGPNMFFGGLHVAAWGPEDSRAMAMLDGLEHTRSARLLGPSKPSDNGYYVKIQIRRKRGTSS